MKKRYHTEVVLKAPKVPYRETIRGKADVQGNTKSRPAGTVSTATAKSRWNRCRAAESLNL